MSDKPKLNNNQQIVFKFLKLNVEENGASIMCSVFQLGELWQSRKFNIEEDVKVDNAYSELNDTQQAEILQTFALWVLQEGEPK